MMTSSATLSSLATRTGIFLTGKMPVRVAKLDKVADDDLVQLGHAHRHFLDREITDTGHFAGFDDDIRIRLGAAEQREAQALVLCRQRALLMRTVCHAAFDQLAFARAACAVLATIGQADAGTNRGGKDGFAFVTGKLMAAGLNGNLKTHTILTMNNKVKKIG